ncbi:MAG: TlpA family protein disulfide reductase [Velocimicrobium sp.]
MNKYVKVIISIAGFFVLIAGSMYAYNKLSKEYGTENNLSEGTYVNNQIEEEQQREQQEEKQAEQQEDSSDTETKTQAIDFTVVNNQGEEVSLTSLIGKPIVLNFWASWCSPCKSEMPDFQKFYEKMGSEVEFVMVNMTDQSRETLDSAKEFIQKEGYTFPTYFDVDQSAAYAYYVTSIPTTFFIDKDGYIVTYGQGALDEETLQKAIEMIMPEKP